MFSLEDDKCVVCKTQKNVHNDLMQKYGGIRYVVPKNPPAHFFTKNSEPSLEDVVYDVKICRKFVPAMEILG